MFFLADSYAEDVLHVRDWNNIEISLDTEPSTPVI
jgi:hypothetical protein